MCAQMIEIDDWNLCVQEFGCGHGCSYIPKYV